MVPRSGNTLVLLPEVYERFGQPGVLYWWLLRSNTSLMGASEGLMFVVAGPRHCRGRHRRWWSGTCSADDNETHMWRSDAVRVLKTQHLVVIWMRRSGASAAGDVAVRNILGPKQQ